MINKRKRLIDEEHLLVLTLGPAENLLISLRDEEFGGSWDKLLKFIRKEWSPERIKEVMPLIKRMMDYEKKHNLKIEDMEEDEEIKDHICSIKLSTGHTLAINAYSFKKDVNNLSNVLINEVFIPSIKKHGLNKAHKILRDEIFNFCEKMIDIEKISLISLFMEEHLRKKYGKYICGQV